MIFETTEKPQEHRAQKDNKEYRIMQPQTTNQETSTMSTRTQKQSLLICMLAILTFAFALPSDVQAQHAAAGDTITNTVSIAYDVGSVTQDPVTDDVTFIVDRLVHPVVAVTSGDTVAPGQADGVLEFTLTNSGNSIQDFVVVAVDDSGTGALGTLAVYLDGGDGVFGGDDVTLTSGGAAAGQFIEDLAAENSVTVYVVGTIPTNATDGNTFDVTLLATAHEVVAGVGPAGVVVTEDDPDGTNDENEENTAFGDTVGPHADDDDEDGQHSATATYTVDTIEITVTKTVEVISTGLDEVGADPAADDLFIPGATLRYTITVSYGGDGTGDNIVVTDDISALALTYVNGTLAVTIGVGNDPVISEDFNAGTGVMTVEVGTRSGTDADDVIIFDVTID